MISDSLASELFEMNVPRAVQRTGADIPTITAMKMMYPDLKVNSWRMLRM